MSPVAAAAVTVRRILVRRPWIYWLLAAIATLATSATLLGRSDAIDAARDSWGETRTVWVATVDHAPGDPVTADRRDVPMSMVSEDAVTVADGVGGRTARQHIAAGEIVHDIDLVAADGPQAMIPPGWLAVPIDESPASGARLGDRVHVVSDGFVVSEDGLVVGTHEGTTLVAVPDHAAPSIPAAADAGSLTLLLVP